MSEEQYKKDAKNASAPTALKEMEREPDAEILSAAEETETEETFVSDTLTEPDEQIILDDRRLKSILESMIFVSGKTLTLAQMRDSLLGAAGTDRIRAALDELVTQYSDGSRGFMLFEVNGGWQFRSNPENADWLARLFNVKPTRLSRAALEVLAIAAYRQPITRLEIDELRGVDSAGVLKLLLERKLIKVIGFKEEIGKPRLYGTTPAFLELFGLKSLSDLPPLNSYEELTEESRKRLDLLLAGGLKVKKSDGAAESPGLPNASQDSYSAGLVDDENKN